MLAAGALRHRVTLTPLTRGRNAAGEPVEVAGAPVTVWADVEPVDPGARFADQALQQRPTHKITIRWRAGVKHRDRVAFRGRTFEIVHVQDPDETRERLELLAAAASPGA